MVKKKVLAICLSVSLAASPLTADAAVLTTMLDSMFMTNATPPGGFASQSRMGLVGGGLSVRSPQSNINVATLDPPRISAGCGGIDLYGGSFSFINADQISALFRQIAANAIGAAFKLAIKAISQQIDAIMGEFQSIVQGLNSLNKSTCSFANQIVKSASESVDGKNDQAANEQTMVSAAWGSVTDTFAGIGKLFSDPTANNNDATLAGGCSDCGNVVWKALFDSHAGSMFVNFNVDQGAGAGPNDIEDANEIIMSLVGTVVMSLDPAIVTPAKKTATNGAITTPTSFNWSAAPLTLHELFDPATKQANTGKITIYKCDTKTRNGCTDPKSTLIPFPGMVQYTREMLFGGGAQVGILNSISNCTNANWTTCFTKPQRDFINMVSAPVMGMMMAVQQTDGAMDQVANLLIEPIAHDVLIAFGKAAINAANNAYSSSQNVPRPDNVVKNIESLKAELNSEYIIKAQHVDQITNVMKYADSIVKNNAGLFVTFK